MADISEMSREELIEVIRIKDAVIKELREEILLYEEMTADLLKKTGNSPRE